MLHAHSFLQVSSSSSASFICSSVLTGDLNAFVLNAGGAVECRGYVVSKFFEHKMAIKAALANVYNSPPSTPPPLTRALLGCHEEESTLNSL
jgi:hypothetical protein